MSTTQRFRPKNIFNRSPQNSRFVRDATRALIEPYGLAANDEANQYRGESLKEIAERSLIDPLAAGTSTGYLAPIKDRNIFSVQALGSTDFPTILNSVTYAALLAGWESAPQPWLKLCAQVDVKNFKPSQRLLIGGFSEFAVLQENKEIAAGSVPAYVTSSQTYPQGLKIQVTREELINNDISALINAAKGIGYAAGATIARTMFSLLESNPIMLDGGNLFNDTSALLPGGHGNLLAFGTDLTAASLGLAKAAMRRQTAPNGNRPLCIRPRYLIVPSEMEEQAWSVAGLPMGFGEAGSDVEQYMIDSGRVEIVSTPYLTGNAWYIAADPNIAPLFNLAFLNGNMMPSMFEKNMFVNDTTQYLARLDFGVTPSDWRGGYMNPGAA